MVGGKLLRCARLTAQGILDVLVQLLPRRELRVTGQRILGSNAERLSKQQGGTKLVETSGGPRRSLLGSGVEGKADVPRGADKDRDLAGRSIILLLHPLVGDLAAHALLEGRTVNVPEELLACVRSWSGSGSRCEARHHGSAQGRRRRL